MRVKVSHTKDADPSVALPAYETQGAAGADVRANLGPNGGAMTIAPGARCLVPTGLIFEIPQGFEVQVRPRSGLALKHGIALVNSPGTIDADYRGPVGVIVINHGTDPFEISHGDRIAQLVLARVVQAEFAIEGRLDDTARGTQGFGSTGVQ